MLRRPDFIEQPLDTLDDIADFIRSEHAIWIVDQYKTIQDDYDVMDTLNRWMMLCKTPVCVYGTTYPWSRLRIDSNLSDQLFECTSLFTNARSRSTTMDGQEFIAAVAGREERGDLALCSMEIHHQERHDVQVNCRPGTAWNSVMHQPRQMKQLYANVIAPTLPAVWLYLQTVRNGFFFQHRSSHTPSVS